MSKHKKIRFMIHYVKPTAQLLFKIRFPKVVKHAGGKWLIHDTKRRKDNQLQNWVARCDIKGSVSTVLNPIFSKKVQGQKHPGRWGIVEHQIPSIKMFKTNTKSHKHPSIRFFIKEQDTTGKPKKTKSGIQPRKRALPYRTWWGAASPVVASLKTNVTIDVSET